MGRGAGRHLFLALLIGSLYAVASEVTGWVAGDGMELLIDKQDGTFTLNVDGQRWAVSDRTSLWSNRKWYDSHTRSMTVGRVREETGRDPHLGHYVLIALEWRPSTEATVIFETSFKLFTDTSVVIFGQRFPNGTTNNNGTDNQEALSAFPVFHGADPSTAAADLHYLSFAWTFAEAQVGKWGPKPFHAGADGGFPLVLHNREARTLVVSPLNHFMVATQTFSPHLDGRFACGLLNTVQEVPKDLVYETILVLGHGVHETMHRWGGILLHKYGKHRTPLDADFPSKYLGYWTDNGAYYYYKTEPGKNYAQTMVDVKRYIDSIKLPVQNYEFDSWWYYKDAAHQALVLWEPMPDVFPDGMGAVDKAMGSPPLTLHNRYFAAKNDYCQNFTCIIEPKVDMAMPIDPRLYEYMMGKAKTWGLTVYEQDWLVWTYMIMENPRTNVTSARQWLMSMGAAAKKLDLTILYCMALHRHLLQSVEIQPVTFARASGDYQPGNSQWQIGYTSALHHALGILPFKDTFWTSTGEQPGCPYKTPCVEPNAELQTLVASLSTGPVGFSDAIGHVNSERVMRTCRMDGLLLKPDRPAVPLDAAFAAQYESNWNGQPVELWHTTSAIADGKDPNGRHIWHYVVSAALPNEIVLTPRDLYIRGNEKHVVFDFHNISSTLSSFDQSDRLRLAAHKTVNGTVGFNYHVVAPVLGNTGWAILGEVDKFVPASNQRFSSITVGVDRFAVGLVGAKGEVVRVALARGSASGAYEVLRAECPVSSSSGRVTLSCGTTSGSCSCSSSFSL